MQEFGYVEIESGIVDEYDDIGLPADDVFLAQGHVAEDGPQMEQHGHEAHICQLTVMPEHGSSYGPHHVAPDEAELRPGISLGER